MTSLNSTATLDYELDPRHLPRSQVERFPHSGSFSGANLWKPTSLRANFLRPDTDFYDLDEEDALRYGSLRDESPFSPMFSELASMNKKLLNKAGEREQQLRRKLLRGANVLIVQGGYSGKGFIYQKLRDLEVNLYMMDGPDSCWKHEVESGLFEDFFEVDFTENEMVYIRAMETVANSGIIFDGVTTYYEDAVPLAARIASALGVEVNPVEACDNARSKSITREVLKENDLPSPKFAKVVCREDIEPACKEVGFPAILKPSYGASSLGVYKVSNVDEVVTAFNKALEIMTPDQDAIWAQGTELLLEEYYDGDEFDIDILLHEAEVVYAQVSDNWACCEPWFAETGTNCPSLYPQRKQEKLRQFAISCTLALGFKYGAFHVECKYTSRGPRLIEVNARMGGVSVRDCNLTAWGVDLVEEHMMSTLKIPIRPVIPKRPLRHLAEAAVNAPYSGHINSETWLERVRHLSCVRDIKYLAKVGDEVQGPESGLPTFIAEIVVVSEVSAEHAVKMMQKIVEEAEVPITATAPGSECPFYFPSHSHPFTTVAKVNGSS